MTIAPDIPAVAFSQFVALLQRGCSLQAAWMACGLPWEQWPAFRRAYRSTESSAFSELVAEARKARGLALALAWTELRKDDAPRWLVLNRDSQRVPDKAQEAWFAPAPASLGAAIQGLLSLLDGQPELRDQLTALIENIADGPVAPPAQVASEPGADRACLFPFATDADLDQPGSSSEPRFTSSDAPGKEP